MYLGLGAAKELPYVDNYFETHLYTGNATARSLTTGLDMTKGGMSIFRRRDAADNWTVYDTVRGATKRWMTNTSDLQTTDSDGLTAFNDNGVSVGTGSNVNHSGGEIVSWHFRKKEKFFTVVEYTGNGSSQNISHDLGSNLGMIWIKKLDGSGTEPCVVWHNQVQSFASNYFILNSTSSELSNTNIWNNTAPNATQFSVGNHSLTNQSGTKYIAYIFANGAGGFGPNEDQDIIKCGAYYGNGNGAPNSPHVTIGWEPQWLLIKARTESQSWYLIDCARGMLVQGASGGTDEPWLAPNENTTESGGSANGISPTATGFQIETSGHWINKNSTQYIYVAIRSSTGLVTLPEAGTDALKIINGPSGTTAPQFVTGFQPDFMIRRNPASGNNTFVGSRNSGKERLILTDTSARGSHSGNIWDYSNGMGNYNTDMSAFYMWAFKRGPGFDVTFDNGTGSSTTFNHSLGRVPEMIWRKNRESSSTGGAGDWNAWHKDLPKSGSNLGIFRVNKDAAAWTNANAFSADPTSTVFSIGSESDVNASSKNYITILFASVDKISKVGTWTGTGSSFNVTFGFRPRFLWWKSVGSGNCFMIDTTRGWATGTGDVVLPIDGTNGGYDAGSICDPTDTGITLAAGANITNTNGQQYIYYAHA